MCSWHGPPGCSRESAAPSKLLYSFPTRWSPDQSASQPAKLQLLPEAEQALLTHHVASEPADVLALLEAGGLQPLIQAALSGSQPADTRAHHHHSHPCCLCWDPRDLTWEKPRRQSPLSQGAADEIPSIGEFLYMPPPNLHSLYQHSRVFIYKFKSSFSHFLPIFLFYFILINPSTSTVHSPSCFQNPAAALETLFESM